jgi:hypothetical protein
VSAVATAISRERIGGTQMLRISRWLLCSAVLAVLVGLGAVAFRSRSATPVTRPDPVRPPNAIAQHSGHVGKGFDACTAPSSAAMDAWLASPYRAVGIYFGGSNRACAQPELTRNWVAHQLSNGWYLLPIYLGLQAPCTLSNKHHLIDPARAAAQGRAEAVSAAGAANALGLPRSAPLVYDMEAYKAGNASCTRAVLAFLGAWTAKLHDLRYFSGVYSSISSGVTDLVNDYNSTMRPHPDYLDFARWNGKPAPDNPAIPAGYFFPHRRIHQYRGPHEETYNGVTINIDTDYLDVAPLPRACFADFTKRLQRPACTGQVHRHHSRLSGKRRQAGQAHRPGHRLGAG